MPSVDNYRASHIGETRVQSYVQTYRAGFYASQWSHIEVPILESIFSDLTSGRKGNLLDFAAGTGRISALAAKYFESVTAVDVSSDMLAKVPDLPNVTTVCADLTRGSLARRFDVCTAFRFFLNAEPALRQAALRAIWASLSPGGHLVANVHMMASSPMGLAYRGMRAVGLRSHETMSRTDFEQLLSSCGFDVVSVIPYSYVPRPGPLFPSIMERVVRKGEWVAGKLLPQSFAQCNLFIASKAAR